MDDASTLPHVTVVIPTHARPALLAELLESLTRQTYPAPLLEVIVVHNLMGENTQRNDLRDLQAEIDIDSSCDKKTEAVVNKYTETASFSVRYIPAEFDGPHPSRILGANQATGSIIAFTDDDCIAAPEWIASAVACFTSGIGLVQGRTLPNPDSPRHPLEHTIQITEESAFYETCNIFYRKEALENANALRDDLVHYGGDTDIGWNVKGYGYTSAFCEDAIVYHEIFPFTFVQWLMEPSIHIKLPGLIRRIPALRQRMFLRYFLHVRTALFDLLMFSIILGLVFHPLFYIFITPYVAYRYAEPIHIRNPVLRMARILFGIPRALVIFLSLSVGSVRSRSLLL